MLQDVKRLFSRLDAWANKAQVRWPKFLRVNSEDLSLAGRIIVRIVKFALFMAVVLGVLWVVYWFTFHGPRPEISNPSQQHALPTLEPSPTAVQSINPWMDLVWLDSAEAKNLRLQKNVINLAYLEAGGVKYSRDHSATYGDIWQEIKPLGMTEISVNGTTVSFSINGQRYDLNVYQPFVDSQNPSYIYIVDINAKTWRIDFESVKVVSVEEARIKLPITINPNPNLSFTY